MITWRQVSPYGLISTCERYRIGKYIVAGRAIYELWDGYKNVGRYPTADQAKKNASTE